MKIKAAAFIGLLLLFQAARSLGQTYPALMLPQVKYNTINNGLDSVFKNSLYFVDEPPSLDSLPFAHSRFIQDDKKLLYNDSGRIKLYQFGIEFYNKNKKLIPCYNLSFIGDSVNSYFYYYYLNNWNNYQSTMLLPDLNRKNAYWFLHGEFAQPNGYYDVAYADKYVLTKSYIDLDANNGQGLIIDTFTNYLYKLPFISSWYLENYRKMVPVLYDAVRTDNGYWIIGRMGDTLLAWPYTKAGIGKPVKSVFVETVVPYVISTDSQKRYTERRDNPIRMSHDGEFAVSLNSNILFEDYRTDYHSTSYIFTYHFDKKTGKFSNQQCIYTSKPTLSYTLGDWYQYSSQKDFRYYPVNILKDIAFSSNDSLFYVSSKCIGYPNKPFADTLFRFQRFAKNIKDTREQYGIKGFIGFNDPFLDNHFTLITGSNGKIYFQLLTKDSVMFNGIYELRAIGNLFSIWQTDSIYKWKIFKEYDNIVPTEPLTYYHHPGFVRAHYKETCKGMELKNVSDSIFKEFVWYFGDGDSLKSNSKAKFTHLYSKAGKMLLRLKGTDRNGYTAWFSDSIDVSGAVTAEIKLLSSKKACQWASVLLQDSLCNMVNTHPNDSIFRWDFGDSTYSNVHNPVHIYTKAGKYRISLMVNNGVDSFRIWIPDTLTVSPAPKPIIEISKTKGCAPLSILVTDKSTPLGSSRIFTDGQGGRDTLKSTVFTYYIPGTYYIHLFERMDSCLTEDSIAIEVREGVSEKPHLFYVSVVDDSHITVHWKGKKGLVYNLYRSRSGNGKEYLGATSDTFYVDSGLTTQSVSYGYQIRAVDSCSEISEYSNIVHSILLTGKAIEQSGSSAKLLWNNYEGDFIHYTLFAIKQSKEDSITTILQTEFPDDDFLDRDTASACYSVAAVDGGFKSLSNTLCLPYTARVFVPNAFSPSNGDSLNNVFLITGTGIEKMHLIIYNRWGERVFESQDKNRGWDGTFKGKSALEGIYLYRIIVEGYDRNTSYFSGNIMLMR